MIYRPSYGRIKDSVVIYDNGCFYLFGMFSDKIEKADYHQVWMAKSSDGVHWIDVGAVIKAPFPVWAMSVTRIGTLYWLNHGSFANDGTQSVIRFWSSENLQDWTYRPELDLRPDTRYFPIDSRLDCMDVTSTEEDGQTVYYGFATGPSGFLKSDDGLAWQSVGPVEYDWKGFLPPLSSIKGDLEIGGCRKIGDKWYLLAGCFNLAGGWGYSTIVLKADTPNGPFRLDVPKYRLYGSNSRWVSFWCRFCQIETEMLIFNSYIYTGYTYENGETWIPPLKRAMIDKNGHLFLAYWNGNDSLKGREIPLMPSVDLHSPAKSVLGGSWNCNHIVFSDLELTFDANAGAVLEGNLLVDAGSWTNHAPECGFFLEETEKAGTAILLSTGGCTRTGALTFSEENWQFASEMEVSETCASACGIEANEVHAFRLLMRHGMFELYVDEHHALTFNTAHVSGQTARMNGIVRLLANGGRVQFSHLRAWQMNLQDNGEKICR